MGQVVKEESGTKWFENYLPFVAKSPEMQMEWLVATLGRLRKAANKDKRGVLSREEITPYIRLLLQNHVVGTGTGVATDDDGRLAVLLEGIAPDDLLLMIDCTEIYDVPRLFSLLRKISRDQAILAMKKVPPPFEKNPLLVMDRVFHAIKEKSAELLESAAEEVLASTDAPENFAGNYARFREIMMDEHILSLLYPNAR